MDLFTLSAKIDLDTGEYEQGLRDAIQDGERLREQLDGMTASAAELSDAFRGVSGEGFAGGMAQIAEGVAQYIACLEEMDSATEAEIASFNAKWQETGQVKEILSQVMADAQFAMDTAYQAMVADAQDTAAAIAEAFDRRGDAKLSGLSTVQGVADGLAAGEAEISARVSEINALLANLAAGSYAAARANAAGIASRIAGPSAPTSASNADGLSYVPYDDYLSYLHRGEAVLTAAQAEDWRAGRAASAPASIDYAALGRAVAQAIAGLSVQMDGQTVGHIVAPTVSADIAEGSRTTRRYAVV